MLTCGLDHIRQPSGDAPLHGRLPFTPARITACGEAWDCAEPVLFCEGEITQFRHGGESFRLFRRIEAPIGGTAIRIRDRVLNAANAPWPHAILYHLNLGYPAVRPGTTVRLGGEAVFGPVEILPQASAGPPVCHPVSAGRAECVVESGAEADAFRLSCGFDGAALPFLQVWADLTAHAGVLSIEPCTSDRLPQGGSVDARPLAAREERTYGLDLDLTGQAPALGRIGE